MTAIQDRTSPAVESLTPAPWGVTELAPLHRARHTVTSLSRTIVTVTALVLASIFGTASVTLASASSAHADFFGIGAAVESWICGLVSPSEPWEPVGDGAEALISNFNLVGVKPVDEVIVGADGSTTTRPPATGDTVPTSMTDLRTLPAGQNYTLYEIAGLRGLSWWTIPQNPDGSTNCSLWAYMWTEVANFTFMINKSLLQVAISIKEATAVVNPLAFLYDPAGGVLSNVFSLFFIPIATLMLLVTAIWLAFRAARGKVDLRRAAGAVGVSLVIAAIGAFLYAESAQEYGFRGVAKTVDTLIGQVNATATNAMFDNLTSADGACDLARDADNPLRGQRATSCVLADSMGYRPWSIGQFGSAGANPIPLPEGWVAYMPDATGRISLEQSSPGIPCYVNFGDCADLRTYLIAQHGGRQIGTTPSGYNGFLICAATVTEEVAPGSVGAPRIDDPDSPEEVMQQFAQVAATAVCSPMMRVWETLRQTNGEIARAYAGDVGITRVSQSMTALSGTTVVAIAIIAIALINLGWHAMTFVLYCLGPFKLAFAVARNRLKLANEWFFDLVLAWSARIAYGIVMGLVILVVVWVLNSSLSFGMKLVWLGVLLYLFWAMIQKVMRLLRPSGASMDPPIAEKVTEQLKAAPGRVIRGGQRTFVGTRDGAGGVKDGFVDTKNRLNDPSRGAIRKTFDMVAAPTRIAATGVRSAAKGRNPVVPIAKTTQPAGGKSGASTETSSGTATRKAGSNHPTAVPVQDVATPVPPKITSTRHTRKAGSPHPTARPVQHVAQPVPPGTKRPRPEPGSPRATNPTREYVRPKAWKRPDTPGNSKDSTRPPTHSTHVDGAPVLAGTPPRRALVNSPGALDGGPTPTPPPLRGSSPQPIPVRTPAQLDASTAQRETPARAVRTVTVRPRPVAPPRALTPAAPAQPVVVDAVAEPARRTE